MYLRFIGCVALIALVLQPCWLASSDWYVVRPLGPYEICINSTKVMAGNNLCPVPDFLIVNSSSNLSDEDKLKTFNFMATQAPKGDPCMQQVVRSSCIKETEVCSLDLKFVLNRINNEQCIKYLTCIPESIFPAGLRQGACIKTPANDAQTYEGPDYDVIPKNENTGSNSERLRQSALTIVVFLAFIGASLQLY